MPVVNVGVGDHMDKLTRLKAGHLGNHHGQHGILHDVPVVGGEHIL